MSSTDFESTLDVRLQPSRRALGWIYLLHFVPLVLLAVSMRAGYAMVLLAVAFALSWWWLRRHPVFGYGPRAIVRLVWQPGTGWQIHDASGKTQRAMLAGSTTIGRSLIVMNFKPEDAPMRTRALFGGELGEEPLRRLRARLLSSPSKPDSESGSAQES
jgi:toxin CptA